MKFRELERDDVVYINGWRNNKEIIDSLGCPYRYINIDTDLNWYDNYIKNRSNTVRCVISNEENIPVGLISLCDIDYTNRSTTLAVLIGDISAQGKGYGYKFCTEIINHAFNNLNLHRIESQVLESNERAINLYTKLGFVIEGTKKSCIFKNGKYGNLVMMGLINYN